MFNNFTKKWDFKFLEMAKLVSGWSKDPSTGCGAIIVRPNRSVASVGFNGLPNTILSGYEPELLADREKKYQQIIHAEINAATFAKGSLKDCCIYTYPLFACSRCATQLLQAGIRRFVSIQLPKDNEMFLRWKYSFEFTHELLRLSDVEAVLYEDFE